MLDDYDPIYEAVSELMDFARGDAPSIYSPNAERQIVDDYMAGRAVIIANETDEMRIAVCSSALAALVGY